MSTAAPSVSSATRWSRDLLLHLMGALTTNIGLVLWTTGVASSLGLAITYFGLVVALGTLLCSSRSRRPREDVVRATIGDVPGTTVNVGGMTAGGKDFNDTTKAHLPLVFGFVLGAAFLLLLVAFRSIVIPLEAIVRNLLSRIGGGAVSAQRA